MGATLVYTPPSHLRRSTKPEPGGLCSIYYIPVEDVVDIPPVDVASGTIGVGVINIEGTKAWFKAQAPAKKSYRAEMKRDDAGPYVETTVIAQIAGDTEQVHLVLDTLKGRKFIVVVERPGGLQRIVGSRDNAAEISYNSYSGEGVRDSPGTEVRFTWRSEDMPLVYKPAVFPVAP